jgi:hypothetical protein
MARLSPERRQAIITAVQQGRTVPEIHAELGEAKRTIAYVAAQAGMTIQSRYARVIRGSYWQSMRGRYWRAARLNAQLRPVAIAQHEEAGVSASS